MFLLQIQIVPIITSALLMLLLAALLGVAIVYMSNKFYVKPDDRVERVRDILSGSNCGACGYPGCDAFAKALINGKTTAARCPQLKPPQREQIDNVLSNTTVAQTAENVLETK